MRGHRFHHVRNSHYLGLGQNRISLEPQGIARAVQPFMMLAHDLGNRPRKWNVFQNDVAGLRVFVNQSPFSRGELGRLGQDFGGN